MHTTSADQVMYSKENPKGGVWKLELGEAKYRFANVIIIIFIATVSMILCPVALTCPNLPKITYGIIKVTGNRLGSKALYKCNYGYRLMGKYLRSCLKSGEWSGGAPLCKRMCV